MGDRLQSSHRGLLAGIAAYSVWGFLPLFWKALRELPSEEILWQRVFWSFVFLALLLLIQGRLVGTLRRLADVLVWPRLLATTFLVTANWFIFIWAVNNDRVLDSSLGYFICPLMSVFLGMVFLRERLRRLQVAALAIVLIAVAVLVVSFGEIPWVALSLGATFSLYALLRKTALLGSLEGLFLETTLLLPLTAAMLLFDADGLLPDVGTSTATLVILSGVATALPLLLFATAARELSLRTVGLLQYINPTIQFLLGAFVFHEPMPPERLSAFVLIWAALTLYSAEAWVFERRAVAS